jgi:hypothetical protein
MLTGINCHFSLRIGKMRAGSNMLSRLGDAQANGQSETQYTLIAAKADERCAFD